MRKLVWLAVGAAGGIWVYRKGQRLAEDAQRDGLVPTVQRTGSSAWQGASSAIQLASKLTSGGQS